MIENVKVFAADIDGTLADKGGQLHPITKAALEALHAQGVRVGLASGRAFDMRLLDNSKFWGLNFDFDFIIASNGGELWYKEKPDTHEDFYRLSVEDTAKVVRSLAKYGFNPLNYYKGYDLLYALKTDEFLESSMIRNSTHVEFITVDEMCKYDCVKIETHYRAEMAPLMDKVCEEVVGGNIGAVCTYLNTTEFLDKRINKGMGLQKYCDIMGYDMKDAIAFGDMYNDTEMIRDAGWGVCLKNGCDASKAVAKDITDYDCTDGGVGHYLYDHNIVK